ncbi:MAG: radical SAM protein [Bacilli bacterium]|nr:radical SAM protein [Bacilli bacterium]
MAIVSGFPKIITINVTDYCDAKCLYCHFWRSIRQEPLSLPAIIDFIQTAAKMNTKAIRISGGEPMSRIDLPQIIKAIDDVDLVSMTCTSAKGKFLTLQKAVESGLDIISISIDLLDEERFKLLRGYSLETVLDNLSRLVKLRTKYEFEIIISTVLTRINVAHLSPLLSFIKDKDLLLNITPFQNGNVDDKFQKEIIFRKEDRPLIETVVDELKSAAQDGVRIINSDHYLDGFAEFLIARQLPNNYKCKAGEKEAIITTDGRIKLCHSLPPLSKGSFLSQWNSTKAEQIKAQISKLNCTKCWLSCYADERRDIALNYCNPSIFSLL